MKKNLSKIDRITRFVLAVVIAILYFTHVISGTTAIILGILALVFILTSFISFCPIYHALGISTLKKKKE
ncbi:MAG: DUF2892 domain-containing protein [Chitinophagaceae bacterium]|nr:DUF2892 domain-containing protein [Chitinophagaceae bacterium]